jgi:L-fuconolactonase
MIVDAHHHFWDRSLRQFDYTWQEAPGMEPICRSFLPGDLQPLLAAGNVDATVLVQTQHDVEENRWALQLAERHHFIAGVVGWVDLASPDCEPQLLEFCDHPKFVGIRHVVQDEPDEDFIIRPDVSRGLAVLERYGVPFDLLFYDRHLRHALTVARRFPDLPLVIDHLSKPKIRSGEIDTWRRELAAVSACENVFCKLSGMVTEADWDRWTVEDLRPCAQTAIEEFGPERLMFGSDWPVCLLAASYADVCTAARELISGLSPAEQTLIMGQTACRFYDLK